MASHRAALSNEQQEQQRRQNAVSMASHRAALSNEQQEQQRHRQQQRQTRIAVDNTRTSKETPGEANVEKGSMCRMNSKNNIVNNMLQRW